MATLQEVEGRMTGADIMVVDDTPANVTLLEELLRRRGHRVRSFGRAADALAAMVQPPHLILLDVNMPGMNGFEFCQGVKSNPAWSQVPVIFISALHATEDKVKALRSGGVDYVSKPFQLEEVYARVDTHLKLHQLQAELRHRNNDLESMVRARTIELEEANRRLSIVDRAKSDFLRLISHELRTPLNGVLGTAEMALDQIDPAGGGGELGALFEQSRQRLMTLIDHASLLTQIEIDGGRFRLEPTLLSKAIGRAAAAAAGMAAERGIRIACMPAEPAIVEAHPELLFTALRSLLDAAIQLTRAGDTVRIGCDGDGGTATVSIRTGEGRIPSHFLARFFDLFAAGEQGAGDLGLGPSVASRIVSLLGGSVEAVNLDPRGVRFSVCCLIATWSTESARPATTG